MGLGFLGALLGRPIGKQHQGPDHFIAPLGLIHEAQLQLGKLCGRFHNHPFHRLCSRGAYVAHCMDAVIPEGTTRSTARGSRLWIRSASFRTEVKKVVAMFGLSDMNSECAVCISLLSSEPAAGVTTWTVHHTRFG
jgi:hypothetical protein